MSLHKLGLTICVLVIMGCQATANSTTDNKKSSHFTSRAVLVDTDDNSFGDLITSIDCPIGLVNDLTLDEEFGPGTAGITRCLEKKQIKVVYQINKACRSDACAKPYALGNIQNALKDYEITHGLIPGVNFEVVAVVHSAGYRLVLANDAAEPYPEENPFQIQVESLLTQGVKIYFCQNTARNKGVVTANLIPGIEYVTAGVTAIADFQLMGYAYLQP